MLRRRLIIFYLFILFTGIFAQKFKPVDAGEQDDDDGPPQNIGRQSNIGERSQNRLPLNNEGIKNNNYRPQNGDNQPSVQLSSGKTAPSTQLSGSIECQDDVKKYCGKIGGRPLSNLKVLQCVDDLDNVSFLN